MPHKIFSLQSTNYKFDQKNINNSDIPIKLHKEVILISKETINNNREKSNTQRNNEKSRKDEITTDVINKMSSSSNQNSFTCEHNVTESGNNNESTTRKNDTKGKEIADKTVCNNNSESLRKRCLYWGTA